MRGSRPRRRTVQALVSRNADAVSRIDADFIPSFIPSLDGMTCAPLSVAALACVCGTIVAMTVEALRTVKDRLSEFVERVQREHERVTITKNGTPAAVLISADDLESLEETLAVLSDRKAVRELAEAEAAVAAGDVVRGIDAVRKLRGG